MKPSSSTFLPRAVPLIGLLALSLLGLASVASAAVIRGVVTDRETQESLGFANVQLYQTEILAGAATDGDGRFEFKELSAGTYELRFSYIGYASRKDTVQVTANQTLSLTIALVPEGFKVETVEVTADRLTEEQEAPPSVVSLQAEQLASIPSVGEPDPIRSLQLLPGVQAASDISSGLYVRGGGPDQNLILLDQVTVYNPNHAFGFFSTFNSDVIDEVNLYKGAYPAEYTGRLGSVLDVQNRDGSREQFGGQGGVSVISGRLLLEGPLEEGSWLISGRRTYLDPVLNQLRKTEEAIPSYYFYDFNGRLNLNVAEGDIFRLSVYQGRDKLGFDLSEETQIDLGWGNRTVAAQYNSLVGENTLASAQFSYSEYQSLTEAEIFSTPFQVDNRLEEISVKADLTAKLGDSHTLKGGLQASRYKFTYFQEFDDDASLDFESKPTDVTAYAEDEWRYENSTITRLGLRTRYFSEGDRILLEPRLSVNRRLTDRLRLKVGAGIYYQYLQLVATEGFAAGDFYFPVDETAEPGRSIQAVSGLTYDFNDQYQVSGEVYYTDLARLLIFDNNATFEQEDINTDTLFLTQGEGYATGLELFAQKRTGRLRGWVGYTLGWTRRTFDELNDGKTFPPKYDRRHDINVVASYESGPWTYGASFVYGTGQAFTPAAGKYQLRDPILGDDNEGGFVLPADRNSARLLPYHRLDVSVRKKFGLFGSQAEWFIQVFNLYSRRNEWFVQFDSSDPTNEPEIVRQLPVIPTIGVNFAF